MTGSAAKPIRHGGALTEACAVHGGTPADWLDLSTGINPVSPPLPPIEPSVWRRLPDEALVAEARAVAAMRYRSPTEPLPVAGAQAAIQLLPQVVDGPVAVVGPTYAEYERCFSMAGHCVQLVRSLADVEPRHRTVVVVNPNNPDGRVVEPADLLARAERLGARDGHLIVDEAFADMQPDISVAGWAGRCPGLIVLRSFGKFYGLAGLRLGFVLSEPALLTRLAHLQGPWAVSGPALSIAVALMRDDQVVEGVASAIRKRSASLDRVLTRAGMTIIGGTPLFCLVDHGHAADLHEALCREWILTRRFDFEPRWLRIGLFPDDIAGQRLADALARSPL